MCLSLRGVWSSYFSYYTCIHILSFCFASYPICVEDSAYCTWFVNKDSFCVVFLTKKYTAMWLRLLWNIRKQVSSQAISADLCGFKKNSVITLRWCAWFLYIPFDMCFLSHQICIGEKEREHGRTSTMGDFYFWYNICCWFVSICSSLSLLFIC